MAEGADHVDCRDRADFAAFTAPDAFVGYDLDFGPWALDFLAWDLGFWIWDFEFVVKCAS